MTDHPTPSAPGALKFTANDVQFARDDALEWLAGSGNGYPRSWAEEIRRHAAMGLELDMCPTIAGYNALEAEGLCERVGVRFYRGQERVHFRITEAGRTALSEATSHE